MQAQILEVLICLKKINQTIKDEASELYLEVRIGISKGEAEEW